MRTNRKLLSQPLTLSISIPATVLLGIVAWAEPWPSTARTTEPPGPRSVVSQEATLVCPPNWSLVNSPNPTEGQHLNDVDAISANDVWAVGADSENGARAFTIHWNGNQWNAVNNQANATLNGVSAVSSNDVWAVGYRGGASIVQHWDGREWRAVPIPNPIRENGLNDVEAIASNDVWAVGPILESAATLIQHWNGDYWSIVPSPSHQSYENMLTSVSAVASNDVWAVGRGLGTLTLHWNGSQWSIVPSPNPMALRLEGTTTIALEGVSARATNDVWAVGWFLDSASGHRKRTLTMHWDGNLWSMVPSANYTESEAANSLLDVVAVAPDDVWAVGNYRLCDFCINHTLIEHWDGISWSIVNSPNGGGSSFLYGATAVSPDEVWAVGESGSDTLTARHLCPPGPTATGTPPTATRTRTPSITPTPTACSAANSNYLITQTMGATVIPGTVDTGLRCPKSEDCVISIVLPFPFTLYGQSFTSAIVGSNGTLGFLANDNFWDIKCLPNQGFDYAILPFWQALIIDREVCTNCGVYTSVTGAAPDRIFNIEWRAMDYWLENEVDVEVRLHEHSTNGQFDLIYGQVPPSADQEVTVGVQKALGARYTEYVCSTEQGIIMPGLKLTFAQLPCSTANTATPAPPTPAQTGTATPTATITLAATATSCAITFTDVVSSDYFYEAVAYLYCNAVVSGYGDGTFRPYNLTTRSQLAKIVVLAEGWPTHTPPSPTFQDVPTTNPFYAYIETAYHQGIISGYGCGGVPSGSCLEFRPGNNVTRSQLCKIIVLAENWAILTPPTPTFRDVPSTDTFYGYIETAYDRGLISGYGCGGVPSGSCLEFRPGNSATRGQICKIAYYAIAGPQ